MNRAVRALERTVRLLLGDDIFVSYSRQDGADYAMAVASAMATRRYTCRIDQWEASPGERVPPSILRTVRRSSMLVVVASKAAGTSENVEQEIETFLRTGRNIVVVDIDGSV